MAKRASKSKSEKDYKALGKRMFTYLKQQDEIGRASCRERVSVQV